MPLLNRDDDLDWLLCTMLGLRSTHGGIVAALEGGGGGAFDSSGAEALCERARPHVARARRLTAIWPQLDGETRRVLTAHYAAQTDTSGPGVRALLGDVALLLSPDRDRLELACCHGSLAANRAV